MTAYTIERVITSPIRWISRKLLDLSCIRNKVVRRLLSDAKSKEWLVHQIAMHEARGESSFDRAPLDSLDAIRGFEDCYWLFSSNELNIGLSQLRFDEAAHVFRQVRRRNRPRVAELGRYKGGTTFLLAAAGAEVLSLENDPTVQDCYLSQLVSTLEHFGLSQRVDARLGDAYSFDVEPASYDFVLVHCSPPTYEHTQALAEHWWPAVSVGGYLILHETPFLPGESAFIEELSRSAEAWHAVREPDTPGENVFFRKLDHSDE